MIHRVNEIYMKNYRMDGGVPDLNYENPNIYWEFGNEEVLDDEFEDLVVEQIKEIRKWTIFNVYKAIYTNICLYTRNILT